MNEATVIAMQAALAAEQAIVYGYGVAGSMLPETETVQLMIEWNANRQRRDDLITMISAAGATPVAAKPVYSLPFEVDTAGSALRLLAHLESGAAGAAWDLVAASDPGSAPRSLACDWIITATVAQQSFTGAAPALPGRPKTN